MQNQIFAIENTYWKSLALTGDEFWLSQNKISDPDKFAAAVQKTGMMKSAYAYPLSSISEISFNEASKSVKLKFQNEKGVQKKVNLGFDDKALSNQVGHYLGEKLGFSKSEAQEQQLKPLLLNLLYVLLAIGGTIFLASMGDSGELTESGTRRGRSRGAILQLIYDILGQTGVIIVGSLITLFLVYQLYKRFTNPAKEVVYKG